MASPYSRQAAYLRRKSLLALRGLAAGAGIDVSDTGTGWRVWRLADGVTLTIQTRYQVAAAFIDGVQEGRKLAATSAETHIGPVPTTVRMAGDG
jgi:hypothetical protein